MKMNVMKNIGLISAVCVSAIMFILLMSNTPEVDGSCVSITPENIKTYNDTASPSISISADQTKSDTFYSDSMILVGMKIVTRGPSKRDDFLQKHHETVMNNIKIIDSLLLVNN